MFISVWLTLAVNKYFAGSQCVHAWQIENLAETNFVEIFGRAKQILSVQCVWALIVLSGIRSPSLFSYLNHFLAARGSDMPFPLENVVPITHEQNIICSKTRLDGTILRISRPLFVGSYLQVTWWALGQRKGRKNTSNNKHWRKLRLLRGFWLVRSVFRVPNYAIGPCIWRHLTKLHNCSSVQRTTCLLFFTSSVKFMSAHSISVILYQQNYCSLFWSLEISAFPSRQLFFKQCQEARKTNIKLSIKNVPSSLEYKN